MQDKQHCCYSVRMPVTLREQLQELAEVEDRRPSQVVRRLIRLAYAEMKRHDAPVQTAQSERPRFADGSGKSSQNFSASANPRRW